MMKCLLRFGGMTFWRQFAPFSHPPPCMTLLAHDSLGDALCSVRVLVISSQILFIIPLQIPETTSSSHCKTLGDMCWTGMTPRCQFAPFSSLHDSSAWAVSHLMWRQSFWIMHPTSTSFYTFSYILSNLYIFILVSSCLYNVMSVYRHVCSPCSSSHIFSNLL